MSRLQWIFTTPPLPENHCNKIAFILKMTTGELLQSHRIASLPLANNGALLLTQKEEILGSLLWMKIDESTARILGFGVHPDLQGKGYGTQCWNQLIGEIKQQKLIRITLEVRESNSKAINFYRSKGLVPKGWIENYYSEERGVLMELSLSNENS